MYLRNQSNPGASLPWFMVCTCDAKYDPYAIVELSGLRTQPAIISRLNCFNPLQSAAFHGTWTGAAANLHAQKALICLRKVKVFISKKLTMQSFALCPWNIKANIMLIIRRQSQTRKLWCPPCYRCHTFDIDIKVSLISFPAVQWSITF